jgi:hypothetical protein
MALTLYKTHNEIIDKLKKLSPADSDDWILRFNDGPKKDKKKTCVACVAKKPDDSGADNIQGSGTFVLFLDRTNFKICKFEKRDAIFPGINDINFNGKSLQELCKRNEWPTIDLILETACRIEQSSAEFTFSINGLSIYAKVATMSSLGSNEPIQLFCDILKVSTDTHPPSQIARTVSLMEPTLPSSIIHQHQQPSTSGIICDMNENKLKQYPQLNRTISVPCDASNIISTHRGPSSTSTISPLKLNNRKERLDSIIDSVATNSIETTLFCPSPTSATTDNHLSSSTSIMGPPKSISNNSRTNSMCEEKGSVLKSLLQNPSSAGTLGLPPGYQMPISNNWHLSSSDPQKQQQQQQLSLRQNSFDTSNIQQQGYMESSGFEIANFGVFSPKEATKKKRQRNPGPKKLTKKQQKELEIQQRQQQQQQSDMFQTAGYPQPAQNGFPSGPGGMNQQQYAQAQAQHQQQQAALMRQQQQQGMFNPNVPSSSRAGQMSSAAMMQQQQQQQQMNHPHHQGMPSHPINMYPSGGGGPGQMTPQQQMQMQQQQGHMMQHGNHPAGWYHPSQQQQQQHQFQYGGQQPGGRPQFIPPPQPPPPAATTTKKTTKRKNAKANNQEQQQQQMMHAQQAATSQQHQPPSKQQFLNPMYGSPQFSSPTTPMNHVSPYTHPAAAAAAAAAHQQHQQQQQQQLEWSKNAGINPPNSRESIRADLRATIQTRQNTSPPQMSAIMSPNEIHPARFTGPNTSNSPLTMMSPPRVSQGPHPGHAAATSYGPGSIPQPSSAATSDHQTNLFSPKQNGFYPNNYQNGMQQSQQHINPQSVNSQQQQQQQQNMAAQMQAQQQQLHHQQQQLQQAHHLQQQQQQHHQHQQQMQLLEELKAFPAVTLDDCKEILQEDGYGDLDVVGFDMMTKQGFEFNYDESRALLQRILY